VREPACIAANPVRQCPLRVRTGHRSASARCLLYPQKRTLTGANRMSALCQKRTRALQQVKRSGNLFVARCKRCELSWPSPIEWNVFARIRRPLEFEAERIHATHDRLTPGHKLSGSGLRTRRVYELRIFSRQACRASQGLGPRLHFARDLRSPLSAVGRDLEGDPRPLRAAELPTFGE
jgi:hypothetical protein